MESIRFNIEVNPEKNQGTIGNYAEGLASMVEGWVISTMSGYSSKGHDIAIIEIPVENREQFEEILDREEAVVEYR